MYVYKYSEWGCGEYPYLYLYLYIYICIYREYLRVYGLLARDLGNTLREMIRASVVTLKLLQ